MSDKQRNAKDKAGPEKAAKVRPLTDPPAADTEARGEVVRGKPFVESTDDDTEGHRRKFH